MPPQFFLQIVRVKRCLVPFLQEEGIVDPSSSCGSASSMFTASIVLGNSYMITPCRLRIV